MLNDVEVLSLGLGMCWILGDTLGSITKFTYEMYISVLLEYSRLVYLGSVYSKSWPLYGKTSLDYIPRLLGYWVIKIRS